MANWGGDGKPQIKTFGRTQLPRTNSGSGVDIFGARTLSHSSSSVSKSEEDENPFGPASVKPGGETRERGVLRGADNMFHVQSGPQVALTKKSKRSAKAEGEDQKNSRPRALSPHSTAQQAGAATPFGGEQLQGGASDISTADAFTTGCRYDGASIDQFGQTHGQNRRSLFLFQNLCFPPLRSSPILPH